MRQPTSARVSRAKGTTRIEFYLARAYKKTRLRSSDAPKHDRIGHIDPKTPREYPPGKLLHVLRICERAVYESRGRTRDLPAP